jgi:hypothetical protein
MSTTTPDIALATATKPARDWTRGYARAGGIAYLITFAASIPAVPLLGPLLNNPSYILTGNADTQVAFGALLDVVNAIACIASAVAVFPVVRRQNESLALGFVTSRVMEAAVIMIGVVSLMAAVTLHQQLAGTPGADPAALQTTGQALVAVRDWTFNFGPNVCAGINALLFGTLLYRSRLVPRIIPTLGLIGAPFVLAASVLTVFGVAEVGSAWFVGVIPVAIWEFSVGIWMTFKGFRPSPLTAVAP